ncbi:hypothetical protein [Streptacidiphilus carbonis]|uniref:hypothetical protein n=1 Tax=Streptacidiphilus carbonis TaxID=105422 RepID=UPI0005A85C72|nr:hypothetical protein [Streptacidiphilus carbonis]
MATAQFSPKAVAGPSARHGSTVVDHDHTADDHRHRPVRTALRGAGIFLDTAWRVVLLGREGL